MPSESLPADLKSRMHDSYNAIASKYNSTFVKSNDPIRLDYISRLLTLLQSSSSPTSAASILELGCGAGIPGTKTLLSCPSPKVHVTANDLSTTQLSLAAANLSAYETQLTLVGGDMMALDFAPATFDAVVGLYSIIHLPREEQTELVRRVAAWMKPGGLLLANFAAAEAESVIEEEWMGEKEGWVFWSAWGEEKSVDMVKGAGFEVLVSEARQDVGDSKFVWIIGKVEEQCK